MTKSELVRQLQRQANLPWDEAVDLATLIFRQVTVHTDFDPEVMWSEPRSDDPRLANVIEDTLTLYRR